MAASNDHYLVISALSSDRPGIVKTLSALATDCQCNILDSRMAVMGGEFAVLMMVSGNDEAVSRMETTLPEVAKREDLTVISKRTEDKPPAADLRPYEVEVIALDNQGIVHEIARFFAERSINIEKMNTETYAAPHTGSPMFALKMTVDIPATTQVSKLREEFVDFCDESNLDATIEPYRK